MFYETSSSHSNYIDRIKKISIFILPVFKMAIYSYLNSRQLIDLDEIIMP